MTGLNDSCFASEEKADLFNRYFTSISIVNDDNVTLPAFENKCQNKLARIGCTSHEIQTLIEILNPNKATGPDEISNKMLKAVAKLIDLSGRVSFQIFGSIQMLYRYRKKEIVLIFRILDRFHV